MDRMGKSDWKSDRKIEEWENKKYKQNYTYLFIDGQNNVHIFSTYCCELLLMDNP